MADDVHMGQIPLSDIQIDEQLWGPGAEPRVKEWLVENFNPDTMPHLVVSSIEGREGYWLLGWRNEGTEYDSLLATIFGSAYAIARLDQVNAFTRDLDGEDKIPDGSFGQGLM